MASINQLVSEIAHIAGQPNNHALRVGIREAIIHTRNEIIRRSYENHSYLDRSLQQRFVVSLIEVEDGDNELYNVDFDFDNINIIKRTKEKVPRPVRLINNLPFHRVSTIGYKNNVELPFGYETSVRFAKYVPGLKRATFYCYTNDYIYVLGNNDDRLANLDKIAIEAAFEMPHMVEEGIPTSDTNNMRMYRDDDEWFLPEDMIGQLKEIIVKRELERIRETNEVPKSEIVK